MFSVSQLQFWLPERQRWLQAHGVYEGTYWDLLANIGELTEALTQMAVGPTVLEEPVLQLPPSPTLPSWDTFKPVLQPLPPLPQVLCLARLRCATLNMQGAAVPCYAVLRRAVPSLIFSGCNITLGHKLLAAEVENASAVTSSHTRAGPLALATPESCFTLLSCPHALQFET